ncbi:MAG: phosphoglycerate kinase [Hyphomicrobiaceae bacterium]|nr:phosphoglycerate kinase [Hyphomicrobiaceae bacterium]
MKLDNLRTTDAIDVSGKRVLVRVDFNVPMKDGVVTDATRLARAAPCIEDLANRGAKVIILSHYGRPKGAFSADASLAPVAAKLSEVLAKPVRFVTDCIGSDAEAASRSLAPGEIAMFENLRFHKGEEKNDADFAAALARSGDIFVGEAFSSSHRAHASVEAITRLLPTYAGPLMNQEIRALCAALEAPERPTAAVVGGSKVSTKIPILTNLVKKVDKLIIGGGMANTFLLAAGVAIGRSLAEPDLTDTARDIVVTARDHGCEIVLPVDAVIAPEFKDGAAASVVALDSVPAEAMILDIGPRSIAHLMEVIGGCRTLLWNGPLGAFEVSPFGEGTFALARAAAALTASGRLVSVAGGGDTVAALNAAGATEQFTYVSTAGGAFLEWLEGRTLPGVAALVAANSSATA